MASETEPLFEKPPMLLRYYESLESRLGYKLVLGDTRHFPYYKHRNALPFPITRPLRTMEDKLFEKLDVKAGGKVLDAGCGVAHVAMHLAGKGLRIEGIDLIDHHLVKARRNVAKAKMEDKISLRQGNFQELPYENESLEGVYSMETVVHATKPDKAFKEFMRVLKPGGKLAMFEYDHPPKAKMSKAVYDNLFNMNKCAALVAGEAFETGVIETMLANAGFINIKVDDYSPNIVPMLRLFYVLAIVPYFFVKLLRLDPWFTNTIAGVWSYKGRHEWRYIAVTAEKPMGKSKSEESR